MVKRLVLFLCLCLAFPAPVISGEFITGSDKLLAVTLHAPPYAYTVNGKPAGLNVEIVRECLSRVGMHMRVEIVPWKRALLMVEAGEADIIFNAVRTPEREGYLHFVDELLIMEETVGFARSDDTLFIPKDLSGVHAYRLGLGSGFAYGEDLDRAVANARFAKVETALTIEQNIQKLLADRIDLFLGDMYPTVRSIKQFGAQGKIDMVRDLNGKPVVYGSSESFLALSRKTMPASTAPLLARALHSMKEDGTYESILKKYR